MSDVLVVSVVFSSHISMSGMIGNGLLLKLMQVPESDIGSVGNPKPTGVL